MRSSVVAKRPVSGRSPLWGGVSHDITWFHLVRGDIEHRVHRHDADKTSRDAMEPRGMLDPNFTPGDVVRLAWRDR